MNKVESMATLKIDYLPKEDGMPIDRLIVCVDDNPIDSVIIGNPMTIDCVIEKLELLAWRLKLQRSNYL